MNQMEDAIYQGPHVSVLQPVAMKILTEEVTAKDKKGQRKVVLWDSIKDNPMEELKITPIAIIPHKSQLFREIMDLPFALRLKMANSFHRLTGRLQKLRLRRTSNSWEILSCG